MLVIQIKISYVSDIHYEVTPSRDYFLMLRAWYEG